MKAAKLLTLSPAEAGSDAEDPCPAAPVALSAAADESEAAAENMADAAALSAKAPLSDAAAPAEDWPED
jgi:hypothetical protein